MNGIYRRISSPGLGGVPRPAFFLDRDGVLVEETGYLYRVDDLHILDGAAEALLALNRAGVPAVIVTNQAGIGLDYYSWSDFETLQQTLEAQLLERGAHFDAVWACAFHPAANEALRAENHSHRKPNPGMLLDAASELNIDLSRSWMAGDKASDIEAGLRAGIGTAFHVLTGYGNQTRPDVQTTFPGNERVAYCTDLSEAVSIALSARVVPEQCV